MRVQPPHLGPGDHVVHLTSDGRSRRYLVHVPRRGGAGRPLPVLMMLHGVGATARWTLTETDLGAKADAEGFLAVFPEGLPPDPSRPPRFQSNPLFWNTDADWGTPERRAIDDERFLTAVFDDLMARFPIDDRQLFVTGFSNGARMTFRLAAALGQRLAAIAPVAGLAPMHGARPGRPIPTVYLIGKADPLVPLEGGEVASPWGGTLRRQPVRQMLEDWARRLGCPTTPTRLREEAEGVEVFSYGPKKGNVELLVYYLADLGHHWPGGKGQLAADIAGPPRALPRANDLIWHFCCHHPLPS